jgi:hypothetical protein
VQIDRAIEDEALAVGPEQRGHFLKLFADRVEVDDQGLDSDLIHDLHPLPNVGRRLDVVHFGVRVKVGNGKRALPTSVLGTTSDESGA